MLVRLQNVAIAIAIALCLAAAIGGEMLDAASERLHAPINQKATANEPKCTDNESVEICTQEAIAHYNKLLAVFTAILSIATVGLGFATVGLYFAGERQLKLSRQEFISSHPPRIRLKHIWLDDERDWRLEKPLEVNIDFVNVGGTTAHVTWVNYDTVLLAKGLRLPQRPPYDETPFGPHMRTTRFATLIDLNSGITTRRTVCDGRTFNQSEIHAILREEQRLYLIGTIEYWHDPVEYRDASVRGLRQTGFCRMLTFNEYPPDVLDWGRFDVVKDSDYEFED